MSSGANPWKLGLFVVLGLSALAGGLWWLGLQHFSREVFEVIVYFDESVNGMDIGAPVKMRGVRIGSVAEITFAADQQTVEVHAEIQRQVLRGLGLESDATGLPDTAAMIERGMRAQLAATGLTGLRYLLVDYFDPERFPVPELPFEPPINYIPAAPSTLKSLEEGMYDLFDTLPPIAKEVGDLTRLLNQKVGELDVAALTERVNGLLARAEETLEQLEARPLLEDGRRAVEEVRAAVQDGRELIARLGAADGPIERSADRWEELAARLEASVEAAELGATAESLRGASDSLRLLTREAGGMSGELRAGLLSLEEALNALRALAAYLERDPAALLRGGG